MMQQPCHPDQIGNQQGMGQQMVLCPVQVVYETQILVKPGDQIQPNQTIYLNPHNPPPWVKNTQQNQVMYVQHMPTNIVPNLQQNVDQNLYIQNCQIPQQTYQIQPQILAPNSHDGRQIQIQNVPANMLQGIPNIGANIQQEQQIQMANYSPMTNHVATRQIVPNTGQIHQQMNQQTLEIQRPVYMNVRQTLPQQNIRQQIIIPHNVPNSQHIGQTYIQTHVPQRQLQISNVPRMVVSTSTTTTANPRPTNTQNVGSNAFTNVSPVISNVRTGNFTFRPIQPRTQYRHNLPNISALTQPINHLQNMRPNVYNPPNISTNIVPVTKVQTTNAGTQINRKRKSESPDEISKKMVVSPIVKIDANTIKQGSMTMKAITVSNQPENTMVTKTNVVNQSPVQVTNTTSQIVRILNTPQETRVPVTETNTLSTQTQTEKDKLIRNTVFTQARGRLLNDKEPQPSKEIVKPEESKTEEPPPNVTKSKEEEIPKKDNFKIPATPEKKIVKKPKNLINEKTTELPSVKVKEEIKQEKIEPKVEVKKESDNKMSIDKDVKALVRDKIEMKRELESGQQILTHVLDGYVIQESNMAFPIRKPLKERKIYPCTTTPNILKEETKIKNEPITQVPEDIPLLPFYHLHLNRKVEDRIEENKEDNVKTNGDNPFATITPATVKSWTVHQLSEHLAKHSWNDTISILQEHEMDGESLFLASKTQLTQIGISEEHADMICDFIKV